MNGDPLDSVAPGEISPFVASARTVNQTLEAVRRWRRAERGTQGAPVPGAEAVPVLTVWVRNDTGGTLSQFAVVKLGAPIISPSTDPTDAQRQPTFPATAPSAAADPFGVLIEPLAAGAYGRAAVTGVVPVYVTVGSSAHGFAAPGASGTTALDTAATGPAKIVWKAGASGTVLAMVLLTGDTDTGVTGTGTDNRIARWDGTSAIQDSLVTVSDAGLVTTPSGVVAATGFTAGTVGTLDVNLSGTSRALTWAGTGLEGYGIVPDYGGTDADLLVRVPDGSALLLAGTPAGTGTAVYAVLDSTATKRSGYTGTLAPGMSVVGGIVVTAGSGTFVSTSAANTFTNSQLFQPASSAGVPVTAQGLSGQTGNLFEGKTNTGTVVASLTPAGVFTAVALNGTYDAGTF